MKNDNFHDDFYEDFHGDDPDDFTDFSHPEYAEANTNANNDTGLVFADIDLSPSVVNRVAPRTWWNRFVNDIAGTANAVKCGGFLVFRPTLYISSPDGLLLPYCKHQVEVLAVSGANEHSTTWRYYGRLIDDAAMDAFGSDY